VTLQSWTDFSYTLSYEILDIVFHLSSSYGYEFNTNHKNIAINNITKDS